MNAFEAAVSLAALASVGAVGVIAGYRRRDPVPIEGPGDPLEDRRVALLRSLEDLEEARSSGVLEGERYDRLRSETDGRLERLTRVIDEKRRTPAPAPAAGAATRPTSIPPWAVALLLVAVVSGVVLSGLTRSSERVAPTAPAVNAEDPFAFFERRVREHPRDLAARLDLAHRYLDAGRVEQALAQYAVALELDPDDAEAHAHIGLILYLNDRAKDGLASIETALESAPDYPEALFYRGVILLRGLDRPGQALAAFERYLEAAPFGAERRSAERLIEEARASSAGAAG